MGAGAVQERSLGKEACEKQAGLASSREEPAPAGVNGPLEEDSGIG